MKINRSLTVSIYAVLILTMVGCTGQVNKEEYDEKISDPLDSYFSEACARSDQDAEYVTQAVSDMETSMSDSEVQDYYSWFGESKNKYLKIKSKVDALQPLSSFSEEQKAAFEKTKKYLSTSCDYLAKCTGLWNSHFDHSSSEFAHQGVIDDSLEQINLASDNMDLYKSYKNNLDKLIEGAP